jgi:AcrR family transcriptional regulator
MPKLWTDTVEKHRHAVRAAALDAVGTLIHQSGMSGVSMTRVAEQAGITRATLYKYFADVEALLGAWHERQVHEHLAALTMIRDETTGPRQRVQSVLEAYALMVFDRRIHEAPSLHSGAHSDHARNHLEAFIADVLGQVPRDHLAMDPQDLARYCIHALGAAGALSTRDAVPLLVGVTVKGIYS